MDAIIYTTNTGSTERYAKLLAQETGLPAYSLADAKDAFPKALRSFTSAGFRQVPLKAMPKLLSVIISERFARSAWGKPERKRTACGKSRLFR